ncbi:hypothetical protein MLD38_012021 [Melastoma candidum]|uniref:Uncharacterized protein n=1 Tax=Melastoma candidum TaxID=119954 RepID=A0ACB9R4D5_9MYRT|nr:hypothetical protein MLD38_012021 [Melastoma candidum]
MGYKRDGGREKENRAERRESELSVELRRRRFSGVLCFLVLSASSTPSPKVTADALVQLFVCSTRTSRPLWPSLRQQHGLSKSANETVLVIEAYKALRDRATYPPNHLVGHLSGDFAFIVFNKSTSTLFLAYVN